MRLSPRRAAIMARNKVQGRWVAQVSLLRPGFLLTNGHGRNTQVSKARPGPPTHYSSAPFSSRQKNDADRTTHRCVLPRERQLPCLAVDSKRSNAVAALIARI